VGFQPCRQTVLHWQDPKEIDVPGLGEWIVILLIVLVVFGANKLPSIGDALGRSIKNFKRAAAGEEKEEEEEEPAPKKAKKQIATKDAKQLEQASEGEGEGDDDEWEEVVVRRKKKKGASTAAEG
jgi:sec-independent protein translocase protein TatA